MPNIPSNYPVDLAVGAQYAAATAADHPILHVQSRRIENVFRSLAVIALLAFGSAALAQPRIITGHDVALQAACDSVEPFHILNPAASTAADARAYWLNRTLIQWPGAKADAGQRFRLYHSARAAIIAQPGARVRGADAAIALDTDTDTVPQVARERFAFIGAGPVLTLPASASKRLPILLTGQLVITREDAAGKVIDATSLQTPGVLDDLYADADKSGDLGSHVISGVMSSVGPITRFSLWAPTARNVALCMYVQGNTQQASVYFPLRREDSIGLWWTLQLDSGHGQAYAYLVDVYVPGIGIVRNRVTDPYSVALTADSKRSVVLDLDEAATKPEAWDTAPRPAALAAATDLSIYELHVRDFSISDATVRAAWRGTYLAFTEADSAGMQHLRALAKAGITDLHLLPVFDIATVPETNCVTPNIPKAAPDSDAQQAAVTALAAKDCFNWGYDPYHFNAPEGSYATDANDAAARIREFRAMVQALHAAGLRVGMDMVYNHTTSAGQQPPSVLDRIVPGYYHRLNAQGNVERSTCCDNTATEHMMMAKLMIDSAALWAKQYRIDSFRFDLMGHQPRAAMARLQQRVNTDAGRMIPLIGEGWNFGEIANNARFVQASQLSLQNSGIATFSDRARDALRGGGCCDGGDAIIASQGWLNGLSYAQNAMNQGKHQHAELLRAADLARIGLAGTLRDVRMLSAEGQEKPLSQFDYAGQPAGYAAEPGEVVNYVENHDNMTLFDLNALRLPRKTSREDRARVQLLGAATTALSQGIAYYHAGIDILRSKSLDRNSYDSGDWFNRLDWSYTDNGFGAGLPPQRDNGKDWPLLKPVLADASIKPTPANIAWMRNAFRDLLKIRSSSTLFRMRSSADVQQRLQFRNVGPTQNPTVLAVHLDGNRYAGAGFREVLYFINASTDAQTLTLLEDAGKAYVLHPVQRSPQATDTRPARDARYDHSNGTFTVPARTVVVYVIE